MCCPQALLSQAPRIDSIDPASGPIAGGTLVTVRGVNFEGATLSLDLAAITPQMATSTEFQFITPKHDNGITSVQAANGMGRGYGEFLYVPPKLKDLPAGYVTTVAGMGQYTGYYRPATRATIDQVGVAFDQQGNTYFTEPPFNRISRIDPNGILGPFAGAGFVADPGADAGDGGPATKGLISFPTGVATDAAGNVYIADQGFRVRRVDAQTGIITTIAGDGTEGFSGDGGPATKAHLHNATRLVLDRQGSVLFLDFDHHTGTARVRKIAVDGTISTLAGVEPRGFSGDNGPAVNAQLDFQIGDFGGIAVDSHDNIYIADTNNSRIRRIDSATGIIRTVAGPGGAVPGDGCLCQTLGITVDAQDNVYFGYTPGQGVRIAKMNPAGMIIAVYGTGEGFSEDGTPIANLQLGAMISDMVMDPAGNLVYSDRSYRRLRRLNFGTGKLETVAGIGPHPLGETGPAVAAGLNNGNSGLAFLPNGNLLLGDGGNFILRQMDPDGDISTVAGSGTALWNTPDVGPALQALVTAVAVATDAAGRYYLSDVENIFRVDPDGTMYRIVGVAHQCGLSGDGGPAPQAQLCQPFDVTLDGAGNLFIADTNNNRVRRVDARTNIITTVAGGGGPVNGYELYGNGSFCGDGGPATEACLNTPYGVAVDSKGELYIADRYNNRIRKVDTHGIITTFAQLGATKMVFDGADNLYTSDQLGVVQISPGGEMTRVMGTSTNAPGFSGDGGPALQALARIQSQAAGIAINADGDLFFVDSSNFRVRAIRYGALLAPSGAQFRAAGGALQAAPLAATFSALLDVLVLNSAGQPAAGVRVEFSAPATGPSCAFSNGTNFLAVVTDRSGHATATCKANLQPGSYVVTATPLNAQASVPFTLTNSAPSLTSQSVVNAATRSGGPVAPGEFVIVSGNAIGPAQPVAMKLTPAGLLSTSLGNAQVLFDGQPAPLLYASANQIYAIVPYAVSGRVSTQLQVEYRGVLSAAVTVSVADAAPGIFTSSSTGSGQAVVLNQDGRPNSAAHPASGNSTIQIFATGAGVTDPASVDGQQDPAVLPKPVLPVRVSIGGQDAEVVSAAAVRGEAAGMLQVSVRVPSTVRSSPAAPLQISLGSYSSPAGTTVAIQ